MAGTRWSRVAILTVFFFESLFLQTVWAQQSPSPPADRVVLGASGSTLSGSSDSGGGGGSMGWLHDFSGSILAVGGDYETLDKAHWEFASLSGAWNIGVNSLFGEVDEGVGTVGLSTGLHHFNYQMEALGGSTTLWGIVTAELETRQIDIDTSRGNLPKLSLGYLGFADWQTTVSYAKSVGGNLGTEITALRIDRLSNGVPRLFAGGALGHVAPPVVNLQSETVQTGNTQFQQTVPSPRYREGFLGVSKAIAHWEWSLIVDYTRLEGIRRTTLAVACSIPAEGHTP